MDPERHHSVHQEIIDAVEDADARLKGGIESWGGRAWARLAAIARSLRPAPKSNRHRPF